MKNSNNIKNKWNKIKEITRKVFNKIIDGVLWFFEYVFWKLVGISALIAFLSFAWLTIWYSSNVKIGVNKHQVGNIRCPECNHQIQLFILDINHYLNGKEIE